MRRKQVEKLHEASRPRPATRQGKSKTSEIQRRRLSKDASVNKDHEKSTEVHKSTEPRRQKTIDLSLSCRRSNELERGDDSVKNVSYRQPKSRLGGSLLTHWDGNWEVIWEVDQASPAHKSKAHRDTVYRDTEKSTEKFTDQSSGKSTKESTKNLFKPHFESACMTSTGWSPKQTSQDDYLVNQNLEVNATYRCLPLERYSTKHCTKAQESAGTLEFGKYYHL